jgi:hypothetical protein
MGDTLRELFEEMVADEPPLRTGVDEAEAAGRRLAARRHTLWTVSAAAVAAAVAVALPVLVIPHGRPLDPTVQSGQTPDPPGTVSPSAGPSVLDPRPVAMTEYTHCPVPTDPLPARATDPVLPHPAAAAAAVVAAGIAPDRQFVVNYTFATTEKPAGVPRVELIFDISDGTGYGSAVIQILPSLGAGSPAALAEVELNLQHTCTRVTRQDYPDGAVALYYPSGPPAQELETTHVEYYAKGGYTMNIGVFPYAWSTSTDPNVPPTPSPLPARGSQPLTIAQVMTLARVIAISS